MTSDQGAAPTPDDDHDGDSSRTKVLLVAGAVVVVLAIAGGLFWFFSRDSPDEVSLESAVEQVTTSTAPDSDSGGGTDPTEPATTAEGIDGTWTVDAETGDFDFESATGSFAGFRVSEELAGIGSTEAVGRTGDVTGEIVIAADVLESAVLEVDLSTITTNEQRRDDRVQDALETGQFPTATFTLTEPVAIPAGASDGEPVMVDAVGELTIHGETQPATAAIEAQLEDGTAVVIGSIPVTFADFGVEVPSAPVVLSASDEGTVEFQLLLTR